MKRSGRSWFCVVLGLLLGSALSQAEEPLAIIAFGAAVESWVLASIWNFAILDFRSIFFQFLISLGLFPIVVWMFLRWQQAFLPQD